MKITDRQIAEEFGMTTQTLCNWKQGSIELQKRYNALRNALLEQSNTIWSVTHISGKKELINNNEIGHYIAINDDIESIERFKL